MKRKHACLFLSVLMSILCVSFHSPAADYQVILTPRGSAGASYTSNVNLSETEEDDDFITTISAGANLDIFSKLSGLSIAYDPSFAKYANNDDNDTLRHNVNLNAWTELTKQSLLQFRNSFIYTEDPEPQEDLTLFRRQVEDPELEEPLVERDTTIRRGRNTYWRNRASINYSNQFSKYAAFDIGGAYSRLENEDPTIVDNEEYNASIGVNYQIHELKSLGFTGNYTKGEYGGTTQDDFDEWDGAITYNQQLTRYLGGYTRYTHMIRNYDGLTPDYQVLNPTIGITYLIAENFTLDAGVGYFWRIIENEDDTQGLTFDGNLGKTWPFKRGAISLTGSAGYDSQDFGAENLGFNQFYGVTGRAFYDFSRHIVGDLSAGYVRNEYTDIDEDRDNYRAVARLSYRILRWLSVSAGYSYYSVNSNINGNDLEDQSVFFSVDSGLAEGFPIKLYP